MLRGERVWLRASTKADFIEDVRRRSATRRPATSWASRGRSARRAPSSFAHRVLVPAGSVGLVVHHLPAGGQPADRQQHPAQRGPGERQRGGGDLGHREARARASGYGTDALNALVDFGFGELRLERIYLHVFDYNARAMRSYEKAGFQTDAILRRSRFHRGEHHDVHLMSILRDDWLAMDRRRAWDPPTA